jgi:hypothetical protein
MKAIIVSVVTLSMLLFETSVFGQSISSGIQFENELVQINTQLIDCVSESNGTAKQYFAIEVVNLSVSPIGVTFKKDLWYDGICVSCDSESEEYISEIELEANATVKGDCESGKNLKVFVKMLELKNVRQLTHFELNNIQIQAR